MMLPTMIATPYPTYGNPNKTHVALHIPDDQWEPTGPDEAPHQRLTGPLFVINGQGIHVEAWEVHYPDDIQTPTWAEYQVNFDGLQQVYEGCYETVEIKGRTYVIVLFPYSD